MKPAYFISSCQQCAGKPQTPCTIISPPMNGVRMRTVVKSFEFVRKTENAIIFKVTCLACFEENRIVWERTGGSIAEEAMRCLEDRGFLKGIRTFSAFVRDPVFSMPLVRRVAGALLE